MSEITIQELLVRLKADLSRYESDMKRAAGMQSELGQEITKTETAVKGQTGAFTALGGGLRNVLNSVGPLLAGFVSMHAAAQFVGDSLRKAIDVEESENLFRVSLGRMADAATQWSQDLAEALGLNEYELRRQIGTWQNFLTSMGMVPEEAFELSKSLTELANDMASFYNIPVEEAFQKLQSGISGEIEPLRRLGVTLDEATVKQTAYRHGLVKVGEELTQQEKAQARYLAIMEQTTNAQGDLARTLESPANQLRKLSAQWDTLQVAVGKFLLDAANAPVVLDGINSALETLNGTAKDTTGEISRLWEAMKSGLNIWGAGGHIEQSVASGEITTPWRVLTQAIEDANAATASNSLLNRQNQAVLEAEIRMAERAAEGYRKQAAAAGSDTDARKAAIEAMMQERARLQELVSQRDLAKQQAEKLASQESALNDGRKDLGHTTEELAKQEKAHNKVLDEQIKEMERSVEILKDLRWSLTTYLTDAGYAWDSLGAMPIEALQSLQLYEQTMTTVMADLKAKSPAWVKELLEKIGQEIDAAPEDLFAPPQGPIEAAWKGLGEDAAHSFSMSLTDGLLGSLAGDDFKDAWAGVWEGLWNEAAKDLDSLFSTLLTGGSLKEAFTAAGLIDPKTGRFSAGGALQLGGGLLMGYGAQRGDQGAGALGGFASGLGMGLSSGLGWYSIIPAVVMGVMGYFSAQGKSYDYTIGYNQGPYGQQSYRNPDGTWSSYTGGYVDITGPSDLEEREMERQMEGSYRRTNIGLRNLLFELGMGAPDMSGFAFGGSGDTEDTSALWRQILQGELPRAIFAQYSSTIGEGLAGMGVGEGRVSELLDAFTGEEFDAALAALTQYVQAWKGLTDLHTELGRSLGDLRTEWDMTSREVLIGGVGDTLDYVSRLSEGLDQLFSEEQVARANEIRAAVEQQNAALVQYIQTIFNMQDQAAYQVSGMQLGWEEQKARENGEFALAQFYYGQIQAAQQGLAGAGSAEEAQRYWDIITSMSDKLWQMDTLLDQFTGLGSREWVEQLFSEGGVLEQYQDILGGFAEEAQEQRDLLLASLGDITTAMTSETELRQQANDEINSEREARQRLRLELEEEREVHRRLSAGADDAAAALEAVARAASLIGVEFVGGSAA